jgi:Co/Zn/Cd efflux system component
VQFAAHRGKASGDGSDIGCSPSARTPLDAPRAIVHSRRAVSTTSPSLQKYAWLSIATAVATISLKAVAWWLTGSVGLLSDALESLVNLAGALMALWMMWLAEQPEDDDHAWGHSKAEYFSSAFEGFLWPAPAKA